VYTKKRRTELSYQCHLCWRLYSRSWVLKRHLWEQHGFQHPGYLPRVPRPRQSVSNSPENIMPFMMLMMMHDLTQNNEPAGQANKLSDTLRLAFKLIEPIERQLSLFTRTWCDLYFPLPKGLVSGLSCHLCLDCLSKEPTIPIKDIGWDLTCEGRHRCRIPSSRPTNLAPENRSKLNQLVSQVLYDLSLCIGSWIPGRKLIVANKIALPNGQDESSSRTYIRKEYDIPNKYHLEDVDFNRSPWLRRLFDNGKIEPAPWELDDFCSYCVGTYAIFRILNGNSFQYYVVFLAPAESIEKPGSTQPNDSLQKSVT
jgi:hypothetical protein